MDITIYNLLKLKEHLNYTDNMQKIGNLPSKESIITAFNFKDYQVLKKEHVSFGKYYDRKNGFEVIQSYAITNQKNNKQHNNPLFKTKIEVILLAE